MSCHMSDNLHEITTNRLPIIRPSRHGDYCMLTQIILLPVYYFIVADVDRLFVHTEPAVASITPHPGSRKLIRLPELEFPLRISAQCAAGRTPESISISVADTHRTFSGEILPVSATLDTSVRIPPRQIAPIAIRDFCITASESRPSLLVTTALTAQISLRCVKDDERSIAFRAEALDVVLNCETSGATAPDMAAIRTPRRPDSAAEN